MKITHFDRPTIRMLKAEIVAALQGIADKYGISIIDTGKGSFSAQNYRFSLEAATNSDDGEALTHEATYFQRCAHLYGLSPDDLGREFINRRSTFKIIGAAAQSYRYPILCKNQNGKVYKFPAATVKAAFAQQDRAKALVHGSKPTPTPPRSDQHTQIITKDDIGTLSADDLDRLIDGD